MLERMRGVADAHDTKLQRETRDLSALVYDMSPKAYPHGSGTTRFRIFVMPRLVPGIHAFVAPAFAVSGIPTVSTAGRAILLD
jgi:hypothetical protein